MNLFDRIKSILFKNRLADAQQENSPIVRVDLDGRIVARWNARLEEVDDDVGCATIYLHGERMP